MNRADEPNKGEAPVHQEIVDRDPEKRVRTLSRKTLENAADEKRREIHAVHLIRFKDRIRCLRDIAIPF